MPPDGLGRTVLVVDDDEDARTTTGDLLRQEGFAVREAPTGAEGLRLAAEHPDLIVLDVHLPDVNGFELCQRLKANAATASIPVLHLSGVFRDVEDRVRGLESGADAYLTRPVRSEELLATIRALLRVRPTRAGGPASAARLQTAHSLTAVGRLLAQSLDLTEVGQRIADSVRTLLGASTSTLYRLQPESATLISVAVSTAAGDVPRPLTMPRGTGLVALAVDARRPMTTPDLLADPRITLTPETRARIAGTTDRAGLAVPLIVHGRVIGALIVRDRLGRAFGEADVQLAEAFADQAALALENARLYQGAEARAEKLKALSTLTGLMTSATDLAQVCHAVAEAAARLLGAELARVWVADSAEQALRAQRGAGLQSTLALAATDVPAIGYGQGVVGRTFASRVPEFILDIQADPRWLNPRLATEAGLHACAVLPLVAGDRALGVLSMLFGDRRAFGPEDRELMQLLADHAAIALHNARLHAEAERRRRAAESLAEVAALLSQSLEPAEVAQRIADSVRTLLGTVFSVVFRLEPGSGDLVALVVSGDAGRVPPVPNLVFPQGTGMAAAAVREQRPVVTADLLADPRFDFPPDLRARIAQAPYRAAVAVPMFVKDTVIGVLGVGDRAGRGFGEDEIRLLQNFADQAAVALENSRLYAEVTGTRDFLRLVTETSADAIVTTDEHGRLTYVSPGTEGMLGYPPDELLGQPVAAFYRGGWSQAQAVMQRLQAEGRIRNYETALRATHGRWIDVTISFAPLRNASGEVTGTLAVMKDVTERKHLEEQLRQAQKMEAIGRLAGGVAHDFNNLLTVIRGRADLLLARAAPDDPQRRHLALIAATVERAAALTRQLLAFSRKQILQPKVVNVNDVVAGLKTMLRRLIGEDIELVTVLAPDLGRVKADPSQLEQALLNLVVNARDAMPTGGRVTVETANVELEGGAGPGRPEARPGSYVRLAVRDTGVGMDEATRSHLFEPFFTTKGPDQGTGLGLATVYGVVTQSGGTIAVDSAPGCGARFDIYLPRVEDPLDEAASQPVAGEVPLGSETVLLVEDDPALRELAEEVLQMYGYTVLAAPHPEGALRVATRHAGPVHVLVTDVVMPQMNGRELADRLAEGHPEMRVFYMSGYTDDAIVRHGVVEAGVVLLQKPFTPEALARTVREVLDQPREPGPAGDAGKPRRREPHPVDVRRDVGELPPSRPPARVEAAWRGATATARPPDRVVRSGWPYVAIVRSGAQATFEALKKTLEAQGIAQVIWDRRAGDRRRRPRPVPVERRESERRGAPDETWSLLHFVLVPRATTDEPVKRGENDERGAHARTTR